MDIETEFDNFFEFPTEDKSYVSSVSAKIFARVCYEQGKKDAIPEGWQLVPKEKSKDYGTIACASCGKPVKLEEEFDGMDTVCDVCAPEVKP